MLSWGREMTSENTEKMIVISSMIVRLKNEGRFVDLELNKRVKPL